MSASETIVTYPEVRPLTRSEYEAMAAQGFFDDERIELIEGVLCKMSPADPSHSYPIQKLTRLLIEQLPATHDVRPQLALAASDLSMPKPDLAVVRADLDPREHPTTAELVIEIANTSQRRDLGIKARIYGQAGVTEYWVADTASRVVHVHRDPSPDGYNTLTTVKDRTLAPIKFPHIEVPVELALGPA